MNRALLAFLAVMMLPLAAAAPVPAPQYLSDGASPFDPGALKTEEPTSEQPSIKPVTAGLSGPMVFYEASSAEQRLLGPLFVGLWTQANLVTQGNLSATIWLDDAGERTLIAESSRDIHFDPEQIPEPASLVPPDPTDPEAAALHLAGQLLPLVMSPPMLFDMGRVDVMVPANATLLLGLELTDGDLPAIGVANVQYDAVSAPSFVYVPWYAPDPAPSPTPAPSPSPSPGASPSPSPGASPSPAPGAAPSPSPPVVDTTDDEPASEDSPGLGLFVVLVMLGVAAIVRRR